MALTNKTNDMNRIIKFRVWNEKLGMNYNPILLTHNDGNFSMASVVGDGDYESDYSVEVMQFTGLHDKNGTEIYEGDILKYFGNNWVEPYIHEVKYDINTTSFSLPNKDHCPFVDFEQGIEIIGNIHENPEPLK